MTDSDSESDSEPGIAKASDHFNPMKVITICLLYDVMVLTGCNFILP